MLFFVFGFSEWPFPSTWQPLGIPHVSQKNLSLCINNGLSGKNHALFGQLYSYTLFGRCWASQTPPRGVSVVGVLKGDGSWNLGTTAQDLAFQGRRPPGRESRTGEAGRFEPFFVFFSEKMKKNWEGWTRGLFWCCVGVCLVCVVCWGAGGWLVSWVFGAVYFLKSVWRWAKGEVLWITGDSGKIFMISMLWGDGQCRCFFPKISMILSPDLGEDLKWS